MITTHNLWIAKDPPSSLCESVAELIVLVAYQFLIIPTNPIVHRAVTKAHKDRIGFLFLFSVTMLGTADAEGMAQSKGNRFANPSITDGSDGSTYHIRPGALKGIYGF